MQKLKKNDFVHLPGNYDGGDYARVVEIVNGFATLEWWWDGALRTSSVEVGADTYERVNDDVNGWLRRTHRKGPYKLYNTDLYGDCAVSEDQLDLMIQFWHDECELPDWSITQLKNVKW